MNRLLRIVVAGYGRWALAERNPAAQVAENLKKEHIEGCELSPYVLPVSSATLTENISRILKAERPDVWIGLGVNSVGTMIQPEMVGINWRHFAVPDVDGAVLNNLPIFCEGPDAYNSGIPNEKIVRSLRAEGIPAQISFHAGTHLCNQMLYSVNHLTRLMNLPTFSGFIHIPQSPENIAASPDHTPSAGSMSLQMSTRAIRKSIEVVRDELFSPKRQAA